MESAKIKVLFVCMGNICRSPTAHGVFEHLVHQQGLKDRIEIESAGTHSYHVGESPDSRAQQTARNRGIDLSYIRARKVCAADFEYYDYILAMDNDNLYHLRSLCDPQYQDKIQLFLDYASDNRVKEVPDPYYGGSRGFENVFDLVDDAARGLLEHIKKHHF